MHAKFSIKLTIPYPNYRPRPIVISVGYRSYLRLDAMGVKVS